MTEQTQNAIFTPDQIELWKRLGSIFTPHAARHVTGYFKGQPSARFVHYTSAEAALKIIKTKRLWMRNTNCMSDFSEVRRGADILNRFFTDESKRQKLIKALDACAPGAAVDALNLFFQWQRDIRFGTYIASLSEHDPEEHSHGRLSMWRAFGNSGARVGIVLNIPFMSGAAFSLNLFFNPVAYPPEESVNDLLFEVIDNVIANCEFLRTLDRSAIVGGVFAMLLTGAVCLKHKGFHEEREWRAIYYPKRMPSPLMESSTEVIGGVPQLVYKIPLDENVSGSIADIDVARIFDRLIIGPSPYPWPMYEAFVDALKQAGIADADNRVVNSDIPIRSM